jgi:protein involved in polysaccharide export with SLBB domain
MAFVTTITDYVRARYPFRFNSIRDADHNGCKLPSRTLLPFMRLGLPLRNLIRELVAVALAAEIAFGLAGLSVQAQCPPDSSGDSITCGLPHDTPAGRQSQPPVNSFASSKTGSFNSERLTDDSGVADTPKTMENQRESRLNSKTRKRLLTTTHEEQTEFQKFVAASTGRALPIYGSNLFGETGVDFGSLEEAPAPPEMIVGPSDELRLRIWGQVNFSVTLRVNREGEIYVPKVGTVRIAGLRFADVPAHVRQAMDRVYRNYDLSVEAGQLHSIQIYVTGFAQMPGEHTISALSTLVNAIFATGGPSAGGSMRHVLVRRNGALVADFDLYDLLIRGDKSGDTQLQSGDVLYIPSAGSQIAILGSVRQQAIFELQGKETVGQVLEIAGGKTALASNAQITIERIDDHVHRRAIQVPSDSTGLSFGMQDGDMLRVDSILPAYYETVTLRGAVANPGHFSWHPGMHLSDLMPDRDALVRRDYWWRRAQLGSPGPEFIVLGAKPTPGATNADPTLASAESVRLPEQTPSASEQSQSAWEHNQSTSEPYQQPLPGPEETLQSPLFQTNWNYAAVERLDNATMQTTLIPFNIGKLVLDHDLSNDMTLMPGDVVTVFTQKDIRVPLKEQTKYVTLEGEIVHPGVYSVSQSDTLASVVERAGGFTGEAYLYAAIFTRKSTMASEAEHLTQFVDEAERQVLHSSMAGAGAGNPQLLTMNRELVSRLRAVHATGRIVLNLQADGNGNYALPTMHMEDGDRLYVPSMPETVQVLGAVFNPHAFLFRRGAKAPEYLHLAGGPNRDADRKHIFVVHADGTLDDAIERAWLHPGDSIVIPEKRLRLSTLAEVLAWTQALSQVSVPAATTTAQVR